MKAKLLIFLLLMTVTGFGQKMDTSSIYPDTIYSHYSLALGVGTLSPTFHLQFGDCLGIDMDSCKVTVLRGNADSAFRAFAQYIGDNYSTYVQGLKRRNVELKDSLLVYKLTLESIQKDLSTKKK